MFTKPQRLIDRVFIHCSASDNAKHDNIETIREWHKERGFNDIGYHYFISSDGWIHPGRNIDITPAAQEGHNAHTIAICLHGLTKFTEEQFKSLRDICDEIHKVIPKATFHGHCEVSSKSCPVFDYRKVLNLDSKGRMV